MRTVLATGASDSFGLVGFFLRAAAQMIQIPYKDGDPSRPFLRPQRPVRDWRVGGHNVAHQGTQEIARRRKQIERGQLKAENGLLRRPA